ncbi:MAG TPA: hypothetical protein VF814_22070 [Casimicrobiaceae bacterium]
MATPRATDDAAGRAIAATDAAAAAAIGPGSAVIAASSYVTASSIDDIIRVEEVSDAEFFIGDLFRRRFHGDPPNYPRSFVAFYQPVRSRLEAVGYVHYLAHEDSYLCGGLVIDERRYRQMPAQHRKAIKAAGGVAEKMLRVTFARLADAPAIWGYVGDVLAEKVDLRAGFRHTTHRHIMVCWNRELSAEEKERRLAKVVALGPF